MADGESTISPHAVRTQLQRILACKDFDASDRNRRFLGHVVEETLAGRTQQIKAYSIATLVFGREPSFDPQSDPIIRIEASRLRRSLERYYLTAGKHDEIRIDVPKGSYIPTFVAAAEAAQPAAASAASHIDAEEQSSLPSTAGATVAPPSDAAFRSRRLLPPLGIVGALMLAGIAVIWNGGYLSPAVPHPAQAVSARGPAILVMPFDNDGMDTEFAGLIRGFTREVIVGLNQFDGMFVYGPATSFELGTGNGANTSVPEVKPDFILSGGVTIADNRFLVTVSLIEAPTGRSIWSDKYQSELTHGDIFQARGQIADRVAQAIGQPYGIIFREEARKIEGTSPQLLTSYQCMLQFYQYWQNLNLTLHSQVRHCLEKAVVEDPAYSEPFAALAMVYANSQRYGFEPDALDFDPLPKALQLALHSVELAPESVQGYKALHLVYWLMNRVDESFQAARQGLAVSPNDSEMMADLGGRLCLYGDWDEGFPLVQEAFARNPAQPGVYRIVTFLHFYLNKQYPEALAEAEKANIPSVIHLHMLQAMAHAQLGQTEQADAAVREILKIDPQYGEHVIADLKGRNIHPDIIRAVVDGLLKAGLKVTIPPGDQELLAAEAEVDPPRRLP
jgi:TolB-like protein/Tfp pilus assembly protein PilF